MHAKNTTIQLWAHMHNMCVHMHIHIYIYTYMYIFIYIRICITDTHIHRHAHAHVGRRVCVGMSVSAPLSSSLAGYELEDMAGARGSELRCRAQCAARLDCAAVEATGPQPKEESIWTCFMGLMWAPINIKDSIALLRIDVRPLIW